MQPSESRRDRLLAAARLEFAEYGVAGARVARIADRAGVNKQLLYYYFGSKAGLHKAATRPSGSAAPSGGSGSPPDRLRRTIEAVCAELAHDPALAASLTERHLSPDVRAVVAGRLRSWLDTFAAAVSDGQGQGYFRDDVDPASVARLGVVLCAGMHGLAPTLTTPEPRAQAWPAEVAGLLLRALTW